MQLDELKKSMSTLEQVLAKTNTEIKINVSASETAQSKILKKFRQESFSCLVMSFVFTAMAFANVNPVSFPLYLKIYLAVFLFIGAVWFFYLYQKLKGVRIAEVSPAVLFSKTAKIKLMFISSEVFFGICLVVLFTLLFQKMWLYSQKAFWAMAITLLFALIFSVIHYCPQYIKLFRDLNSIKE